jgi:hypothetical protein
MIPPSSSRYARRDFLRVSTLAMTGLGLAARPARAEPPPEMRTLRLSKEPYACIAPQYVVDEFLAAEGFSSVERVEVGDSSAVQLVAKGELHFELEAARSAVTLDLCALEPDRAARTLVDRNITPSYDDAIQTMKDVVYTKWREYQPEDTLRFYALRLHEAGMIKTSPQKIIAQGTDWRFLNELKKELKA